MAERKGPRSPTSQERQRDADRTRRRILDAAAAEFAAHGFAGARTSAIAARAQVNQQLISYYFDSKQGVYDALSQRWQERENELIKQDLPLADQLRHYVLEAIQNSNDVRLLAWAGLEYNQPADDPDHQARSVRMARSVEHIRRMQTAGDLPTTIAAENLLVMLVAICMVPTTLPHIIAGLSAHDPTSPEFIEHWAEQVAALVAALRPTTH